jgi:protein-L-isoaspartate(D-aspartate) O-methyltransferase
MPTDPHPDEVGLREAMVAHVQACGVRDARVLAALRQVRRHRFLPGPRCDLVSAYGDHPADIGHQQTISQPYIVGHMTELLRLKPGDRVLEVGTGCGYQAAVLAACGATVYTIEVLPTLADHARQVLAAEGFPQVQVRTGNGWLGWPEEAPFDAILVACAPAAVPPALPAQLAEGARLVIPVGVSAQELVVITRRYGQLERSPDLPVRFVPMLELPAPLTPRADPP